ncbi:Hypothetical protein ETEE_0615 [Edwardsiella anguillarum ET080813]|uniref:Uncharacterized protein n=1 Tax=Edwardsiella anguillarum ET080813 TaxID=667120 RepID=A0A076LG44_9GAMM|nr:Hypothetical protein ETEE_0615 [Edwardsiella anguillarum ET080813]
MTPHSADAGAIGGRRWHRDILRGLKFHFITHLHKITSNRNQAKEMKRKDGAIT